MKLASVTLSLVVTALAASALVAQAAPRSATLVIRHQLRGCHTWSLNGSSYKPVQMMNPKPSFAHG